MRTRSALVLLALLAVGAPLVGLLWGGPEPLVGYSGVARGEFENWAFNDWWIPRYAACLVERHAGSPLRALWALIGIPRDLDIGNCLDDVMLSIPANALLGPVFGHDVRAALVLLLNALAALWACRQAIRVARQNADGASDALPCVSPGTADAVSARENGAALVCAVALACNPVTLWDVAESRYAQALIALAVAYLGSLLRWVRDPSARTAVLSGTLLGLTGLVYWYAALFVAPIALAIVACRREAWRGWALHIAIALAITAPFAAPFLVVVDAPRGSPPGTPARAAASGPGTPFPPLETLSIPGPGVLGPPGPGLIVAQSVDLASPLKPPMGPPLPWGLAAVAILSLAAWTRRKALAAVLVGSAALWIVLSFGPYLHLHGTVVGDGWLYQTAYQWVPGVWRLNWPARTLAFTATAMALLAAPAVATALTRTGRATPAATLCLSLLPLLAAHGEGLVPLPITPLHVPSPYREGLPGDVREGVVELSLPVNSAPAAWYQRWHGRPLLGGLAFCPHDTSDASAWTRDPAQVSMHPLMRWADAIRRGSPHEPWPADTVTALSRAGFPWIVVQRMYGGTSVDGAHPLTEALSEQLGPPAVEVPEMCAWRVRTPR